MNKINFYSVNTDATARNTSAAIAVATVRGTYTCTTGTTFFLTHLIMFLIVVISVAPTLFFSLLCLFLLLIVLCLLFFFLILNDFLEHLQDRFVLVLDIIWLVFNTLYFIYLSLKLTMKELYSKNCKNSSLSWSVLLLWLCNFFIRMSNLFTEMIDGETHLSSLHLWTILWFGNFLEVDLLNGVFSGFFFDCFPDLTLIGLTGNI